MHTSVMLSLMSEDLLNPDVCVRPTPHPHSFQVLLARVGRPR